MVWKVAQQVPIPLIGIGGITCVADALEFLIAGASAVQVGTATFIEPKTALQIIEELERYLLRKEFRSVSEVVGSLEA
jgi:dihydroorotate dehydrogenase (NAD+) catalytic subunit